MKIANDLPEFAKHLKAFKAERSQIERTFGLVLSKFKILTVAFKGRGPDRVKRFGQIFLLACQLTNLAFEFKKSSNNNVVNMVDSNPSLNFDDLLKRC